MKIIGKKIRASMAVECALIVPLVVVLIALFLSALKTCIGFMIVRRAVLETAQTLSDYSYLYELLELDEFSEAAGETAEEGEKIESELKGVAYQLAVDGLASILARTILAERLSRVDLSVYGIQNGNDGLSVWGTRALYASGSHKAVIKIKVSYTPVLIDEGRFLSLQKVTLQGVTHAFLGDNPFETITQSEQVYQIGDGEKYHSLDCYLIDKTITELSLFEAQQAGYTACSYCKPWETDAVYVSSGGLKYHTDTCPHLYPNLTALTLEEAEEKGLEPCELCQGEEEYFTH